MLLGRMDCLVPSLCLRTAVSANIDKESLKGIKNVLGL
jgi:hypothetical protein